MMIELTRWKCPLLPRMGDKIWPVSKTTKDSSLWVDSSLGPRPAVHTMSFTRALTWPSPTVSVSMTVMMPGTRGLRLELLWMAASSSVTPEGSVPVSCVTTFPTIVRPLFSVYTAREKMGSLNRNVHSNPFPRPKQLFSYTIWYMYIAINSTGFQSAVQHDLKTHIEKSAWVPGNVMDDAPHQWY